MAFAFLPSKNFAGSSGYSASGKRLATSVTPKQQSSSDGLDYAVYDISSNKVVSLKTGQPYNGVDPRTGNTYSGGILQAAAGAANAPTGDPTKDYQAVQIEKSPEIASATQGLLAEFKKNAESSLANFNDYLKSYQTDIDAARQKSLAATDTSGTEAALGAAKQQYTAGLAASDEAYRRAMADTAARERAVVTGAVDDLTGYDDAVNRMQQIALNQVPAYMSRFKLRTGTPTSLGSADVAEMTRQLTNAAAPFELAKINQRYAIRSGMELPVEQQLGNMGITYAGSYLPSIAGANYGADVNIAQYIQGLRQSVAGMSFQDANAYLTAAGVPDSIKQSIFGGYTQNLGAIAGLMPSAYYQGLNYVPGAQLSQPAYYNMGTGGYPTGLSTLPSGTSRFPTSGYTSPINQAGMQYDSNGLGYGFIGGKAGGPVTTIYTGGYGANANTGSQNNAVYNPITGAIVDPVTGANVGPQNVLPSTTRSNLADYALSYGLGNLF